MIRADSAHVEPYETRLGHDLDAYVQPRFRELWAAAQADKSETERMP